MRRALLLYNPASGQNPARRLALVERAAGVLRAAGVQAELEPTGGPGIAGEQARTASESGFDTVIAAGGDGTVHDVLQGVVGHPQVAVGVLPLGTANALACDLGIPRSPEAAARTLLAYQPRTVAVGKIESNWTGNASQRFFTVMAGVGPDAELIYQLSTSAKQRFGMSAYVAHAGWLYMRYHYAPFEARFQDLKTGELRTETVAQVMAVRIANFGGPLRKLAPGANLEADTLRVILFKQRIRITYPAYLITALLGLHFPIPGVELWDTREIQCTALNGANAADRKLNAGRIYSEADGELLGGLPIRLSIVPRAFTLLMNPKRVSDRIAD